MNELFDSDYSETRALIRDIARECPDMIMTIREFAVHHGSQWQHHIPTMQRAIEDLRRRCEYELSHLSEAREDYLQLHEIAEDIQRRFCKLTRWLSRMIR